MEQRYHYRVSRWNGEDTTVVMHGDIFIFDIKVLYHAMDTGLCLQYCSASQSILSHHFFQEGKRFLNTLLLGAPFFIQSLEPILDDVVSTVRELFHVLGDDDASSPSLLESSQRVIPLIINLFVLGSGVEPNSAVKRSMHLFGTVSESAEKSMVLTEKDQCCCSICLEDLNICVECFTTPCCHVYHQKCILAWLQTVSRFLLADNALSFNDDLVLKDEGEWGLDGVVVFGDCEWVTTGFMLEALFIDVCYFSEVCVKPSWWPNVVGARVPRIVVEFRGPSFDSSGSLSVVEINDCDIGGPFDGPAQLKTLNSFYPDLLTP
ncbi:hypothetical protein VNO78_21844 [Psophocarpus tetragonolobus]|uniref:RING-type domain-containing protein n=1 Tax=Psophocarpus tetragonolobus TaxID=3891 RepID=A0AAN9XHY2_PSOTE